MKVAGRASEFIVIGENIHTTRMVLRKGKRVTSDPEGRESVRYLDAGNNPKHLTIPESVRSTQDYEEGRVKHVKIAIQGAMSGEEPAATEGMAYLDRLIERQVEAKADYLDLNVDEISLKLDEQKVAMKWLVETTKSRTTTPLSIDSSNIEIIQAGLEACQGNGSGHMLNSASLERLEALDLAKNYGAAVIVTAAGDSGMPENEDQRVANASKIVDLALVNGLAASEIYIDPLIFPISVDGEFGHHALSAIRILRQKYGPEIHITGGFSNVSFGIPCRHLVNNVFLNLVVDAGADSGIIDPIASKLDQVFVMDRNTTPYRLAEDMLLGRDEYCANFLRAYRKGELNG